MAVYGVFLDACLRQNDQEAWEVQWGELGKGTIMALICIMVVSSRKLTAYCRGAFELVQGLTTTMAVLAQVYSALQAELCEVLSGWHRTV